MGKAQQTDLPLVEVVLQSRKPSPMAKSERPCSPSRTRRKWDPSSSTLLMVPLSARHRWRGFSVVTERAPELCQAVLCIQSTCITTTPHRAPGQSSLTEVCPVQPGASTPKGKASRSPGLPPERSAAGAVHGRTLHHGAAPARCRDKAHGGSTRTQCQPGSALQPLTE